MYILCTKFNIFNPSIQRVAAYMRCHVMTWNQPKKASSLALYAAYFIFLGIRTLRSVNAVAVWYESRDYRLPFIGKFLWIRLHTVLVCFYWKHTAQHRVLRWEASRRVG